MLFSTRDRSLGKRSRSTEVLRLLKRLTVNGQVPLGMPLTTVVCPAKDKVFKRYHRRIPVKTYPCLGNHTKSNKFYRLISDSRVHTPSISNHQTTRVLKSSQKLPTQYICEQKLNLDETHTRIDSSSISLCRCAQFLLASKTIQTRRHCDRSDNRATIQKCIVICKLISKSCSSSK